MKLKILLTAFFFTCFQCLGQETSYGGVYSYGTSSDEGATGVVYVYPKSDTELLFYLELSRGAPSYNNGAIVGGMTIYNSEEADFTYVNKGENINCSMNFWFTNNTLYIRTNDEADNCGYGYGIFSNGDFKKIQSTTPQYFIDREGREIWFKDLNWKKWWLWD